MTDSITFKDADTNTLGSTSSNVISLQNNVDNFLVVAGTAVAEIEATLTSELMELHITPQSGAGVFKVKVQNSAPNASGIASGGVRWEPLQFAPGVKLTIYRPALSQQQIDWLLDPRAPPTPLTVKIKRL